MALTLKDRHPPPRVAPVATDGERPAASDFVTDPSYLDLRTDNQQATVRLRATDAESGVARVDVVMKDQTGGFDVQASLHRIGGSANDGLWEATVPFLRCRSKAGTWTARVEVHDEAGLSRATTRRR